MNRGSNALRNSDGEAEWASMRPRFMNRGSAVLYANRAAGTASFNEAPIHESGKSD